MECPSSASVEKNIICNEYFVGAIFWTERCFEYCILYMSIYSKLLEVQEYNKWRYGWIPNKGAVGKIWNEKRTIQSEKSMRKSMLIEVTVDDSNGFMSFRADKTVCEYVDYNKLEVMIIPRYLKKFYSFKLRTI